VLLVPCDDMPADWRAVEVGDYVLLPILRDEVITARDGAEPTAVQRAVLPLETAQVSLTRWSSRPCSINSEGHNPRLPATTGPA
jgi:hypothetical protein